MNLQILEVVGFMCLLALSVIGVSASNARKRPPVNHASDQQDQEHAFLCELKYLQDKIAFLEAMAESREREIEDLKAMTKVEKSMPMSRDKVEISKMIIGIDAGHEPTRRELKMAYIKSMKKYHPDNGGTEISFRMAKEAFEYLSERA